MSTIISTHKIYLAPSLKYLVTNRAVNFNKLSYIDEKAFTKKLMWSSSRAVYHKSVICSSRYTYTNLIILRANCKTLQRLVDQQPIPSDYFLWSSSLIQLSKNIILLAQRQPFLMVTRLHSPAWLLFLWLNSIPNPTQFVFFLHTVRIPALTFLFLLKKEKEKKKWKWFWLDISMTVCLQRPL